MILLKKYFNSWCLPSLIFLIVAIPFVIRPLGNNMFYSILLAVALIGIFIAAITNLVGKRRAKGFSNLAFFVLWLAAIVAIGALQNMFGSSEDGFADNLSIPANIEITLPRDINSGVDITPQDIRKHNPSAGKASINLFNSFQPGLYKDAVWVNPGEAGSIYLKAFEATKGASLSYERLKKASDRPAKWSKNLKELFFSSNDITIYEGDWGKPYAARFEVWFVPDSGTPERKLMERVFEIEGWQR